MNGYTNDSGCWISHWSQVSNGLAVKVMLLAAMCIVSGCSSIGVSSTPSGAHIFMNEANTGMTTPASIRVRDLPLGRTYITVEKEGYHTVTPKQELNVEASISRIVWSVFFPPLLIKNLCGDLWKGITYPPGRHLEDFNLQLALGAPSATKTVQSEVLAMPLSEQPKRKPTTNADVMMMIKAKLPETTIISAIKQGPSDFDTSPSGLIELKNQGATGGMLDAILGKTK